MANQTIAIILTSIGALGFVAAFIGTILILESMIGEDKPGGIFAKMSAIIFFGLTALAIVVSMVDLASLAAVQKEVGELYKDVSRLAERITNIDNRHSQISEDFRQVRISMEKVQKRALRIQNLDLEEKKEIKNIETIKQVVGSKK